MGRAIIDDVARMAGVSIKTVSRVMNKEPNVRQATREKVMAAATVLNYHPSQSARGLAGNRTFLLALIYDNPSPSYLANMQRGILETCEKEGYGMVLKPVQCGTDTPIIDQVTDFMVHSRVDGLILTPPACDDVAFKQALSAKKIPHVAVAPPDRGDKLAVILDDRTAAEDMTNHLINLGHKDIAFIKGHPSHGAGENRYDGFCAAMKSAGLTVRDDLVTQGYFTFEDGINATAGYLALADRPSAIFAANDEMAAGAMHHILDSGLSIPRDISVVGFDDTPISRQIWPAMTTVRQPIRRMGRIASETLLTAIHKREGDTTIEIPFTLKIRNSSGPA